MNAYLGINGKAKRIKNIYIGINGKAKKITKGYIGRREYSGGTRATLFFSTEPILYPTTEMKFTLAGNKAFCICLGGYNKGTSKIIHNNNNIFEGKIQNIIYIENPAEGDILTIESSQKIWSCHFFRDNCLLSVDTPIPENWRLSSTKYYGTDGPWGMFQDQTKLISIPDNLFDSQSQYLTSVDACFSGCSNLTSPVPEFWDKTKFPNITSHSGCFYGCTKAANYADIPSSWK